MFKLNLLDEKVGMVFSFDMKKSGSPNSIPQKTLFFSKMKFLSPFKIYSNSLSLFYLK